MKTIVHILILCCGAGLASCKNGFVPIAYGSDACAHCRMTIMDDRYAAELVTEKGRSYKFDDLFCMRQFIAAQDGAGTPLVFVEDYLGKSKEPLDATKAIYLEHEFFTSPMNGHYAAFATEADAKPLMDSLKIPPQQWSNLR